MAIDVAGYKKALESGNRAEIVAKAHALVLEAGAAIIEPRPPNVNASFGADNKTETNQYTSWFNRAALRLTDTAEAYNREAAQGRGSAEAEVLASQCSDLETYHASLTEIERIEKGDGFGAGGGFDKVGEPPYVARLEAKLERLLKKAGA